MKLRRRVFDAKARPAEKLTGQESLPDILRTAIGLEKDPIVFYLGIKRAVAGKKGRERVEAIITEEMGHIVLLDKQLVAAED